MNSKNTTYLTKVFSFCAAHQYGNEKWTEQENWDVFGKDTRVPVSYTHLRAHET